MSGRWLSGLCLLAVAMAAPAAAQPSAAVSGYFTGGAVLLAAGDSFDAVAGSSRAMSLGGGVTVGLWNGLFVDAAVTRQKIDGQRVFVSSGTVFPLGIPWRATFVPIDLAAGWRFSGRRVTPYVGAGATIIKYSERSDFAQSGDNVSERKAGAIVLGGVDVPLTRWIGVGGEVRYRLVSGVLGSAGVSEAFGEDQLGGVSTAVRVSIGRQ